MFPHVPNPPQAAHMGEPNQVQCCTLACNQPKRVGRNGGQSYFRALPPTLPGIVPMLNPPQAAHGDYANQVQCCTLACNQPERAGRNGGQKKKDSAKLNPFSFGIRQRPTLPGRLQPSTIGAERLNFCVRYGNRWIPFAIVTGKL